MAAKGTGDPCPCNNIVIMQLFHELKQKFPAVPDRVVSECIRQNCHDKRACESLLRRENQGYLMHSYPMALKLSVVAADEAPSPGKPCERCSSTKSHDADATSLGAARTTQSHYYSSVRETAHVLQNTDNMNRQVVSVVRDTVLGAGESGVTSQTQWFAQGATSSQFLPMDDCSFRSHVSPLVLGSDNSESEYGSPLTYPQFASGNAQYQHVESRGLNCSPFAQVDVNSNPLSKSSVAQCVLQETHSQRVTPRQCQTRSSVSVQSSTSTTVHRPRSLDVGAANVFDQSQPWSAPDMPPSFQPFTNVPAPAERSRTSLTVEPAPHYSSSNYWGGGSGSVATSAHHPRSYTSVNLTLRPPSLDPLPPIDIHSAGTSLTYSTSSYDPRQGFQSQLQIRIGPGGVGSVSALRTRGPEARPRSCYVPAIEMREEPPARAESLPDVTSLSLKAEESSPEDSLREQLAVRGGDQLHSTTHALLAQQLARKERLLRELKKEKQKLREMQREVRSMESDLEQRQLRQRATSLALPVVTSVLQKVQCLRQEIQYLQQECKKMTTEVDLSADAHVPLGETDEAFYKNIYTGQRGYVLSRHQTTNTHRQETRGPSSPLDSLDLDGPNWTCTECTFRNHPLLDKCEQCEMPRIILGGETQDIHIHVTHHNFPARRVLHSWVV